MYSAVFQTSVTVFVETVCLCLVWNVKKFTFHHQTTVKQPRMQQQWHKRSCRKCPNLVESSQESGLLAGEAVPPLDGGDGALHVARHQELRQLQQTVAKHKELQRREEEEGQKAQKKNNVCLLGFNSAWNKLMMFDSKHRNNKKAVRSEIRSSSVSCDSTSGEEMFTRSDLQTQYQDGLQEVEFHLRHKSAPLKTTKLLKTQSPDGDRDSQWHRKAPSVFTHSGRVFPGSLRGRSRSLRDGGEAPPPFKLCQTSCEAPGPLPDGIHQHWGGLCQLQLRRLTLRLPIKCSGLFSACWMFSVQWLNTNAVTQEAAWSCMSHV